MIDDQIQFEKLVAVLRKHKLKVTRSREAILKILMAEPGPFTIEEVHQKIGRKDCDWVTVYRILQALERICLVRKCDFGDGTGRYELVMPEHRHHHHIRCRVCKKIEPVDYCGVENVEPAIEQVLKYQEISHSLEFFGICPECQKKSTMPQVKE